jgi:hypothetical protein
MHLATIKSILRGDPEAIVAYGPHIFLAAFLIIALSLLVDGTGILAGFFAAGLGGAGILLANWRTERGLWMLAGVYLVVNLFVYGCFSVGQIRDALQGVQVESVALLVDFTIGTLLLVTTIRFLVNVARENYQISRSRAD